MEATEHQWTRANMVAGHNWWHAALFHHARDDHEAVLAIFDDKVDFCDGWRKKNF
jgi:hypothetical protein